VEGPIEEDGPLRDSRESQSEKKKTPMKMEEEWGHPPQMSSLSHADSKPAVMPEIANPIFYQRVDSEEELQVEENEFVVKMNSSHIVLVDERHSMAEETV